ncbi:MAG: hypothetical protein D6760_10710 [Deltaproteobacteria bacterium]|nr:MAG: hypothetical protein D6760_10710 [Deltaproteobacteria bacterium]
MKRNTIRCLLMASALAVACTAHAADYVPGRGLRFAGDRLVLGGYLAAGVSLLDEEPKQFKLDDLSAFVTYSLSDETRIFSEVELEDALHIDEDGIDVGRRLVSLERLYLEWEPAQSLRVRLGQMLMPIGIWNPIHAAPLVWTTSRPLATEDFFDTGLTGIQIDSRARLAGLDLTATLFGQATDHLDATNSPQRTRRGVGGRLQIGRLEQWHAAVSAMRYKDARDRRWRSLAGADLLIERQDWELSGEAVVNEPDNGQTIWGLYAQAVYHLGGGFYPVFRYEHVRAEGIARNPLVAGIAYKPAPNAVLKLEGIIGRRGLGAGGNGVEASLAVLF